jgi:hypothetical protein
MKSKIILCLALVLSGGLIVVAMCWHPHGIPLSGSEDQIRASILKITPLGTPIEEVKVRIQTKLHSDTFYYFADGGSLPPVVKQGEWVHGHWPLGPRRFGKQFGSIIGQSGIPLLTEEDVGAYFAFDANDRLADVFVGKTPDMP